MRESLFMVSKMRLDEIRQIYHAKWKIPERVVHSEQGLRKHYFPFRVLSASIFARIAVPLFAHLIEFVPALPVEVTLFV